LAQKTVEPEAGPGRSNLQRIGAGIVNAESIIFMKTGVELLAQRPRVRYK
jgi:hypothetical protein